MNGLGLTKINIMPHFDDVKNEILDGKHFLNEILLPDSFKKPIIAFSDGTYILIKDNTATIFGSAYEIKNGKIKQICKTKKVLKLNWKNT